MGYYDQPQQTQQKPNYAKAALVGLGVGAAAVGVGLAAKKFAPGLLSSGAKAVNLAEKPGMSAGAFKQMTANPNIHSIPNSNPAAAPGSISKGFQGAANAVKQGVSNIGGMFKGKAPVTSTPLGQAGGGTLKKFASLPDVRTPLKMIIKSTGEGAGKGASPALAALSAKWKQKMGPSMMEKSIKPFNSPQFMTHETVLKNARGYGRSLDAPAIGRSPKFMFQGAK